MPMFGPPCRWCAWLAAAKLFAINNINLSERDSVLTRDLHVDIEQLHFVRFVYGHNWIGLRICVSHLQNSFTHDPCNRVPSYTHDNHAPFSNADSQLVIEIAVTTNDLCERQNTMMPLCGTFMASCLTVSALFRLRACTWLHACECDFKQIVYLMSSSHAAWRR